MELLNTTRTNDRAVPDEVTIVHFTGRKLSLHAEVMDSVLDQLLTVADEPGEGDFLLDLANVECISARTIGALITLQRRLFAKARRLRIVNAGNLVQEVFAVAKVEAMLGVGPTPQQRFMARADDSLDANGSADRLSRRTAPGAAERWIEVR